MWRQSRRDDRSIAQDVSPGVADKVDLTARLCRATPEMSSAANLLSSDLVDFFF